MFFPLNPRHPRSDVIRDIRGSGPDQRQIQQTDSWFHGMLQKPLTFIVMVWALMIALVYFCFFLTD